MDTITFEIGDVTIQLVKGQVLFWNGTTDKEADIEISYVALRNALSTASMLRTENKNELY